jgi:hypothetical protein
MHNTFKKQSHQFKARRDSGIDDKGGSVRVGKSSFLSHVLNLGWDN